MRGLWDQERPISPSLLRTALTFMGLLLGVWAVLNVFGALGALLSLDLGAALNRLAGGIAVPLAIWIGLRLLADLVILQNQAVERLGALMKGDSSPTANSPLRAGHGSPAKPEPDASTIDDTL